MLYYTPQILLSGNPVITDTVNWIKISGTFTADGGEKYITISNFQKDSNTVTEVFDTSSIYDIAYYYVDDVSVMACADTSDAVIEYEDPFHINLFPNPNDGNMTLSYTLNPNDKGILKIYDITGKEMYEYKLNARVEQLQIGDLHLKDSIYFYQIIVNDRTVKSEKLIIINTE